MVRVYDEVSLHRNVYLIWLNVIWLIYTTVVVYVGPAEKET